MEGSEGMEAVTMLSHAPTRCSRSATQAFGGSGWNSLETSYVG